MTTGRKANLYATLGPTDKPGIALSGHTDVVPVDGQDWTPIPGCSASATAGSMAAALRHEGLSRHRAGLVPEMLRRELNTPIHLAFSYDEEVGCLGVRRLLKVLQELPVRPKACIIGEPTR